MDNGNVVALLSTQKSLETLSPPPSTDIHESVIHKSVMPTFIRVLCECYECYSICFLLVDFHILQELIFETIVRISLPLGQMCPNMERDVRKGHRAKICEDSR